MGERSAYGKGPKGQTERPISPLQDGKPLPGNGEPATGNRHPMPPTLSSFVIFATFCSNPLARSFPPGLLFAREIGDNLHASGVASLSTARQARRFTDEPTAPSPSRPHS